MESSTADLAQPNPASVVGFPHQLQDSGVSQKRRSLRRFADTVLKSTAQFWFLVAVIGQLIFGLYICRSTAARPCKGISQRGIRSCRMGTFPAIPWATLPSPRISSWRRSSPSADRFNLFRKSGPVRRPSITEWAHLPAGPRRFRPEDVSGPVPEFLVFRPIPCAAGCS